MTRLCAPLLFVGLLSALGCATQGSTGDAPPVDQLPTVHEVAMRYNTNLARMQRLWAAGVIEMRWADEDGKMHFEQGEVTLLMQLPHRVAMPIQKLGIDLFWLGGDADRYWFFDLRDDKAVYFGAHAKAPGAPGPRAASELPVPIRPADLPRLLGIVPIDVDDPSLALDERVAWDKGAYVIVIPRRAKLRIDPKSSLPVGVELLDDQGVARLSAVLSRHQPVETEGAPPGAWPRVATRIVLTMPERDGTAQLELAHMTSDETKFNPRAFDFDYLVRVKKPAKVVNLDD